VENKKAYPYLRVQFKESIYEPKEDTPMAKYKKQCRESRDFSENFRSTLDHLVIEGARCVPTNFVPDGIFILGTLAL
jgi:hypothetical protein